ncbi:MAG: radical SAM protein [Acidobacteria bacterium]|nr:radical SAM protein [Acidobacteriota bacterium]
MRDAFGRPITYIRVSITDRCDLRCLYCMPAAGVVPLQHADILSYEEIADFLEVAASRGIETVRITGGEPLVRRDVTYLVARVAAIAGVRDLCMTTNGSRLEALAAPLRAAGLHRVNVSLDALDPGRYRELTRGGEVERVVRGLHAARDAGLWPIKINCVVDRSSDEPDARAVGAFAAREGFEVRYIRKMDIARGSFGVVEGGSGGDCGACNRLRLSADGYLRPCLLSDIRVPIRGRNYAEALDEVVGLKPAAGTRSVHGRMSAIGG